MTTLFDFLLELSTQPRLQSAYRTDPDGTLRKAGLPAQAQQAIRAADKRRLDAALLKETRDDR